MERNENVDKKLLMKECISKILEGTNVKEVLENYEGISVTDLFNFCNNDQKMQNALSTKVATYIQNTNPTLDEYLTLFQDERKEPLDAVLLGLNDVAKPFRKNPESDIMRKLNSDMMTMKKYKEPYKAGNRYGVLNRDNNEMKYASDAEIDSTLTYIEESHKDAIDKLGFVPDYLVSQYVRKFLEHDKARDVETLEEVTAPTPPTYLRDNLIKNIEAKQARKNTLLHEINDLDKYINFMDKSKEQGRED